MELEHPDITRTLRTGYPNIKKAPTAIGASQNTQFYYNRKKYILLYEEKRDEGAGPTESFAYASGVLAFDSDADMEMLQELYFHYLKDLADFSELEREINE